MGADYSFYVKFIATGAPTFFGHIISVLAIVNGNNCNFYYLSTYITYMLHTFYDETKQN